MKLPEIFTKMTSYKRNRRPKAAVVKEAIYLIFVKGGARAVFLSTRLT
jgi:hypothetical protein